MIEPLHLLNELRSSGFSIVAESGNLIVTPRPEPELVERIRQCKPELLELLSPRRLTDGEKADIAKAFHQFREQHGRSLVPLGWDRNSVFLGVDPLAATTWGEVPGVIGLLLSGWGLTLIFQDRLEFGRGGDVVALLRGGVLVSESVLDAYQERAAIREYDGGMERSVAERAAANDMASISTLLDDRKFVESCLQLMPSDKRAGLRSRYVAEWQKAAAREPSEIRKNNVGRYAANRWIREQTSKPEGKNV